MISVIVPVYNAEKHLGRCIESILGQTYKDLELILVDDGSRDNSLAICRNYERKDSRVRVFSQENQGVSAARNQGLSMAGGDYIQFVDSDDYIKPEMSQSLITAMEHSGAELVICGYEAADPGDPDTVCPHISGRTALTDLKDVYPEIFEDALLNSPCNKLYCRDRIREGFPAAFSMGEDLLFNLQYLEQVSSIFFLPQALYCYDRGETGLSSIPRSDTIEIAHRLYLAKMEAREKWGLGELAEQQISTAFVQFFIYGISGMYLEDTLSSGEKLTKLRQQLREPDIRRALAAARMSQKKHRIVRFLLQHRLILTVHMLMLLNRKRYA